MIDKIEGALRSLGARLEDVVRTRVFVKELHDWEAVARAHGERFGHIQPANTLVRAELIGEEYLVEMEAEAEVAEGSSAQRRLPFARCPVYGPPMSRSVARCVLSRSAPCHARSDSDARQRVARADASRRAAGGSLASRSRVHGGIARRGTAWRSQYRQQRGGREAMLRVARDIMHAARYCALITRDATAARRRARSIPPRPTRRWWCAS